MRMGSGRACARAGFVPADGFTLIETLVAMAVLAVAATGLMRATQAHVDLIGGVKSRAAAGWAADDALAEARVGIVPERSTLLGREWHPTVAVTGSDDRDVAALGVTVRSGAASATIRGFRDAAPAP